MKNRDLVYINIDEDGHYLHSIGVSFLDFMDGLENKLENIVMLGNHYGVGSYSRKIGLDYLNQDAMFELLEEDVSKYGDFTWVDYKAGLDIEDIEKETLAELLYIGHTFKLFKGIELKELENNYIYLSHDDSYYVKIYMKDLEIYKGVLARKISKEFKGRKKSMESLPEEILTSIYKFSKEGLVLDFENMSIEDGISSISIYRVGECSGSDQVEEALYRHKNILRSHGYLSYSTRSRRWELSYNWN